MSEPDLRSRLSRGIRGQAAHQSARILAQFGSVALLATHWGAELYGEWLILYAVPAYLILSDFGLLNAAGNEMVMRVSRGDLDGARTVFQAVSVAVAMAFVLIWTAVLALALVTPVTAWLGLSQVNESSADWILLMFTGLMFLTSYAIVLSAGGFASAGLYGSGLLGHAGIALLEFAGLAAAVVLGGGPLEAATAMLVARAAGTLGMYAALRRRVGWLRLGRPRGTLAILRPLAAPALGSFAFTGALVFNVQGIVLAINAVMGPASVAVFSIIRTFSRGILYLLAAIPTVTIPELARAYAQEHAERLRRLHRAACQIVLWLAVPMLAVLAGIGLPLIELWTQGEIVVDRALFYVLLAVAALEAFWVTSLMVIYARNRHKDLAVFYLLASVALLPATVGLLEVVGLVGAALALLALQMVMLVKTLHISLPAAHDTFWAWLRAIGSSPAMGALRRPRDP